MTKSILWLAFAMLFTPTIGANRNKPRTKTRRAQTIALPLEMHNYSPHVMVTINGQGPFSFAIDTAATGVMLDTKTAQQLALPITGAGFCNDTTGRNTRSTQTTTLQTLALGTQVFSNVEASILNLNGGNAKEEIQGILGIQIFEEFLLTLDFPKKNLYLARGSLGKADHKKILPLKRIQSLPAVEIHVQGAKVDALIDTGNLTPRLIIAASLAPRLVTVPYNGLQIYAHTWCNNMVFSESKLKLPITIGEYFLNSPVILSAHDYKYSNIGSAVLKNFAITFDQKNRLVRFIYKYNAEKQAR